MHLLVLCLKLLLAFLGLCGSVAAVLFILRIVLSKCTRDSVKQEARKHKSRNFTNNTRTLLNFQFQRQNHLSPAKIYRRPVFSFLTPLVTENLMPLSVTRTELIYFLSHCSAIQKLLSYCTRCAKTGEFIDPVLLRSVGAEIVVSPLPTVIVSTVNNY